MKADEPRAPIVKYGMTAEYVDCIVRRHFGVLADEQAVHGATIAHNMRVAPAMVAALEPPPPFSPPNPAMPAQAVLEADSARPDLRGLLGLS